MYPLRPALSAAWVVLASIGIGTAISLSPLIAPSGSLMMPLGRTWAKSILRVAGVKVRFEGVEHLSAKDKHAGPFIFMANHASALDILCIAPALPNNNRWLAKRSLQWIPFFGWAMLATGGCVFIERGDHERARESLRKAAERIRNGLCMVVFPEGTRSKDGHLLEFKKGPFHLAAEARVPIVPVALIGTSALLPSGSMGIQSGEVLVRFGEPLEIKEGETHVEIAARTRVALEKLLAAA
ncbi:MAG TPA: lysophospholipid acyltransferase family protein [Polyangium sp.]|nr:lysophospholipid acyltransferase family protein [Polyangium sp.]